MKTIALILAAGRENHMHSGQAKELHQLLGKSLLATTTETLRRWLHEPLWCWVIMPASFRLHCRPGVKAAFRTLRWGSALPRRSWRHFRCWKMMHGS